MDDMEQSDSWLQGLARLNRVIAATGQPLIGNLCYEHLQADFVDAPPNPILRSKRDRFRRAVEGRTKMLEVGVNGGHSAYVALTANPVLEFHGVDICEHAYVRPAVVQLQNEFPGRVFFHEGSCLEVLPALADRGRRFDLFHIDGAKRTYLEDVLNCERIMAGDSATLIMDDTQMAIVAQTWRMCTAAGVIEPHPGFPTMLDSEKHHNQIGTLKPVAPEKRANLLRRQESRRAVHPLHPAKVEALRRELLKRNGVGDATLISVLAYAGVRPSEALALTWRDVGDRTLIVDKELAFGDASDTKTQRARAVMLLRPLASDLAEWKLAGGGRPDERRPVFPLRDEPWTDTDYWDWCRRCFMPAATAVGLEGMRPYDLRHSLASLLFAEGVDPVEIAEQMGHSLQTLLRVYTHVIEELRGQPSQPAERLIRQAREARVAQT